MTATATVIAIDGTFASGKGTLAKRLAAHYGLNYLDTGKLYRAVAKSMLVAEQSPDDGALATQAAQNIDLKTLDDPDLKSGPVGAAASRIAVHKGVRAALLEFQRSFAKGGAVLDGRDIGTVICPNADVKLYVDASDRERARRRHLELTGYGEEIDFDTVLDQLKERDGRDKGRAEAALKPADDAHFLDTTGLSIEEVVAAAIKLCDAVLGT